MTKTWGTRERETRRERERGTGKHRNVNTNDKTDSHRRHKDKGTKGNLADKRLNWEHKKTQKHSEQLERCHAKKSKGECCSNYLKQLNIAPNQLCEGIHPSYFCFRYYNRHCSCTSVLAVDCVAASVQVTRFIRRKYYTFSKAVTPTTPHIRSTPHLRTSQKSGNELTNRFS